MNVKFLADNNSNSVYRTTNISNTQMPIYIHYIHKSWAILKFWITKMASIEHCREYTDDTNTKC